MVIAPLPADEAERLALLDRLEVLDTPSDPVLDGLVHCASLALGCPIGLVSLLDARRQWFKARHGLDARETPRDLAFCAHTLVTDDLLEVHDARLDPRFHDNPLVTGELQVVFYAGVPLEVGGHRIGTLCALDHVPRRLTEEQRALLFSLGRAAAHWFEHRRERLAAAARDALLNKLALALPGFVYQFRMFPDGRMSFPFASEHVRELFEIAPADVQDDGGPMFARVHADDLPGLQASILESARTLSPWHHEFRVNLPTRGLRWLEGASRPEPLPDGGVLWHGFVTDVSERRARDIAYRQVQQRWEVAVGAAQLGLVEIDPVQATLTLDASACRQHALAAPTDGERRLDLAAWLASFEPGDRARLQRALDTARADGAPFALTLQLVRGADAGAAPDGAHHLEIAAQRTGDGPSGGARLIGCCRDVSEQVQLEQLKRDKLAAERARNAQSEFLSRVSHELRTPLNAILGFTQLLRMDHGHPLDDTQRGRVDQVQRASTHLLDLINDVLDLTRLGPGSPPLTLGPVALGQALESACAMIETLAQQRAIRLERPALHAPLAVQGDLRTLEQVLVNLLSNGVKYNRHGGRLAIALRVGEREIGIDISDEGAGLSMAQLTQMFRPFNRLGAEHAGIEGSGLGLVIAKSAVEAMGGSLSVSSTPGQGATFSVQLMRAVLPEQPLPASTAAPAPVDPSGLRRATLLYIEDEPVNALLVVETLRAVPQWEVIVAADGEQGLALARSLRPDLLLVDINLPRLNGNQVVQALRRDPATRALHCIALSADALPEQIATAREAGFDDYWTKPIDLQTLMTRLAGLLAAR